MGHRKTAARRVARSLSPRELLRFRRAAIIDLYGLQAKVRQAQHRLIRIQAREIAAEIAHRERITASCLESIKEQRVCWRSMATNLQSVLDELSKADPDAPADWLPDLALALGKLKEGAHKIADAAMEFEPGVHLELLGKDDVPGADETAAPVGMDY